MPAGSFRQIKPQGPVNLGGASWSPKPGGNMGAMQLADLGVGNVGGHAGYLVRKLPRQAVTSPAPEGFNLFRTHGSLGDYYGRVADTAKAVNRRTRMPVDPVVAREASRVGQTPLKATPGDPLIAPYVEASNRGLFQLPATGAPSPAATQRGRMWLQDLHEGNVGPRGQVFDFGLNHHVMPLPGVTEHGLGGNAMAAYALPRVVADPRLAGMGEADAIRRYWLGGLAPGRSGGSIPPSVKGPHNHDRYLELKRNMAARHQADQSVISTRSAPGRAETKSDPNRAVIKTDPLPRTAPNLSPTVRAPAPAFDPLAPTAPSPDFLPPPAPSGGRWPYAAAGLGGAGGLGGGGYALYNLLGQE